MIVAARTITAAMKAVITPGVRFCTRPLDACPGPFMEAMIVRSSEVEMSCLDELDRFRSFVSAILQAPKKRLTKSGQIICGANGGPAGLASNFRRNGVQASPFIITTSADRRSTHPAATQ